MTRSLKKRRDRLGEYYYIGHFVEGELRDKLTVYRTYDYYYDSDNKRYQLGNYFKTFDDARLCLGEYDEAVAAAKRQEDREYDEEGFAVICNYAYSYQLKMKALVKQISCNGAEILTDEKGKLTAKRKEIRKAVAQIVNNPLVGVRDFVGPNTI